MNNPYANNKPSKVNVDKWVNEPKNRYDTEPKEEEKTIKVASYLSESIYMEVIQKILPSLAGKKTNKQGIPLKPTIADYIRELILTDIENKK